MDPQNQPPTQPEQPAPPAPAQPYSPMPPAPQPGYAPYGQPPVSNTNGLAIAGFVCAFFIPLLGFILSILGLSDAKKKHGSGQGLAIAGIVVSVLIFLISIPFWIGFFQGFSEGLSETSGFMMTLRHIL